jgi:hypothetical protein
MDLVNKDKLIHQLQSEINKTQTNVMEYLEDAKNIQKENEFLESVTNDYKRYHGYILKEKEREHRQMQMLVNYLNKILREAGLSAELANRARFQQNQILGEMENIKGELDRLTKPPPIQTNVVNIYDGKQRRRE